MQQEDQQELL